MISGFGLGVRFHLHAIHPQLGKLNASEFLQPNPYRKNLIARKCFSKLGCWKKPIWKRNWDWQFEPIFLSKDVVRAAHGHATANHGPGLSKEVLCVFAGTAMATLHEQAHHCVWCCYDANRKGLWAGRQENKRCRTMTLRQWGAGQEFGRNRWR